jgi:hypothetical protein
MWGPRFTGGSVEKGNVTKSCEFTTRAAPGFTHAPGFSGVFAATKRWTIKKQKGT